MAALHLLKYLHLNNKTQINRSNSIHFRLPPLCFDYSDIMSNSETQTSTSTSTTSAQPIQDSTTNDTSNSSQSHNNGQPQANTAPEVPPNTPAATNGVQSANTGSDNSGQTDQPLFLRDILDQNMSAGEAQRLGFEPEPNTSQA